MCVSTLLQDLAVSHRRDELLLCFADPYFLLLRSLASTPYVWQLRPPSRPAILTTFSSGHPSGGLKRQLFHYFRRQEDVTPYTVGGHLGWLVMARISLPDGGLSPFPIYPRPHGLPLSFLCYITVAS